MNTRLLLSVARRHKVVLAIGTLLGIILAISSVYALKPREGGGLRLSPRAPARYEYVMQLLIQDSRFAVGRAGTEQDAPDAFERTVWLTPSYAQMIQGDAVRSVVASDFPMRGITVKAEPLEKSPIVQLTLTGRDAGRVEGVAGAYYAAFRKYLEDSQQVHGVPARDRIYVTKLSGPTMSPPGSSRALERGILAFLVPLSAALGLAYFLENLESGNRA